MTSPTGRRLRPRKQPVQARAVETRARILDAAARVFGRHGYAAGTTNRIAAEAGLSIGSLYQYFPNKDALLVELVRRHVEHQRAVLGAAMRRALGLPPGLPARIAVLVDAAIDSHLDDPALHQVLFEEAPRPPSLQAELRAVEREIVEVTASLLTADPAVTVGDPQLAARLAVTTIESLVHRNLAVRQPEVDLDAFRRELVTLLVRYLTGADGPAPPPARGCRPRAGHLR